MPHCSAPACKGNYKGGPKVSVFGFPKDKTLRSAWIKAIFRENFIPTKSSKVCELHFQQHDIERTTSMYDTKTGKLITAPLSYPRLKQGAVPSLLPGCPKYLSKPASCPRRSPETRRVSLENSMLQEAIQNSLQSDELYREKVLFHNFCDFLLKLDHSSVGSEWIIQKSDKCVNFLLIPDALQPQLACYVQVRENLQLNVFCKDVRITSIGSFQLPEIINNFNTLDEILVKVSQEIEQISVEDCVKSILNTLDKMLEIIPEKKKCVMFLKEQLSFLASTSKYRNRYSWETILFCSLLHCISPHAYKFIRSSDFLTLPHPRTVKQLCSNLPLNPITEQGSCNFLHYVSSKFSLLNGNDVTVSLMMDEIHLKPSMDFKGGYIAGTSNDSTDCASSACVFMIQSLLSSYKDVVHVLPVKTMTSMQLHETVKKVIIGLEQIGFEVLSLVFDNSIVNRKAVSLFATPPQLRPLYEHPRDANRPLFCIPVSVHNLKNARNNWYNKKPNRLMSYPDFADRTLDERIASWNTLENLYAIEKESLLKYSHKLTLRALQPTPIERQNVKYALQIFDHTTAIALRQLEPKKNLEHWEDTADYIDILCKWWDVVNVKTLLKGKRLNNTFQEPITKQSNHILEFLNNFLQWLDHWQAVNPGGLTRETHKAFRNTTEGLIKMSNYCLNEKGYSFFLCGKIQTDTLEDRFGRYRQLAGSQYHISIRQLYESESKLRLQETVPLILKSYEVGNISVSLKPSDLLHIVQRDITSKVQVIIPAELRNNCVIDEESDIDTLPDEIWSVLAYVAGYCSHAVKKHFACDYCSGFLIAEKSNYGTLIDATSRGGLCYPQPDALLLVVYTYVVVKKLIGSECEHCFLQQSNHRNVVITLAMENSETCDVFLGHQCRNSGHKINALKERVILTATNIFLNNYIKRRNDNIYKKGVQEFKRLKMK